MPRANEKPFPCEDCRFRGFTKPEGGHLICRRNPPTCGDGGDEFPMVWLDGSTNCFSGEPLVERSCRNCRHVDGSLCTLHWFSICERLKQKPNWHCCDWEEGE